MSADTGDVQIERQVGYLGTGKGTIEVLLGHSPSYYRLHAERDDFEAQLAVLVRAWKDGAPVRRKDVSYSPTERELRTDDRQIDSLSLCDLEEFSRIANIGIEASGD